MYPWFETENLGQGKLLGVGIATIEELDSFSLAGKGWMVCGYKDYVTGVNSL